MEVTKIFLMTYFASLRFRKNFQNPRRIPSICAVWAVVKEVHSESKVLEAVYCGKCVSSGK